MKKTVKRIISLVLIAVMVFGSAPLGDLSEIDFNSLFGGKASAASSEYALFPMDVLKISRANRPAGDTSVGRGDSSHYTYMGWDFIGSDHCLKAPFKGKIVDIQKSWCYGNSVILQSVNKVELANGKIEYLTCIFAHDNDVSNLKKGDIIEQGNEFYSQGDYGNATGVHVHIEIGVGQLKNHNEVRANCIQAYEAFVLKDHVEISGDKAAQFPWKYISDLDTYLSDMIRLNQEANATATVTQKSTGNTAKIYPEPADTGNNIENYVVEVAKGEKVAIKGWLENKSGNIWYRVEYKDKNGKTHQGWMYKGWVTNIKEHPLKVDINYYVGYDEENKIYKEYLGSNLNGYAKKKDKYCISVRGSLESPGRKITELSANIYKVVETADGIKTENVLPIKVVFEKDQLSYEVKFENTIDPKLNFKNLEPGKYLFIIHCKLENSKLPGIKWYSNLTERIKQIVFPVEYAAFTVYDENTSSEQKTADLLSVRNIKDSYDVRFMSLDAEPSLVKKTVNYVEPPVTPVYNDTGNSNTGYTSSTPAKTYYTGTYRTTTADSLNIRTGPGSSYSKATSPFPKGTLIGITEVSSNGWGKTTYNGVTGWVCLSYCTYLQPFAQIQKPGKVTVSYNSESDIAEGTNVNVSWNAIDFADAYNVYLKKSDGTVVKTQTGISGTSTYFTVDNAGTYYITVTAVNSQYVGDESAASAKFTAHAPCTVSFVDWNGRAEIRRVKYSEAATAPIPPTREGYTFMGWDKSFDHVTSDITVNATYKIKSYTVKFVKTDEHSKTVILKSEKVDYGNAATPPEDTQNPEFYTFVDWNSADYKCVKENLTIKAVYKWINSSLPVGISNVTATRVNGGYTVSFKISCTDAAVTNGRAIVSFKTAAGKQIVTTESAAFSLASGTINKSMEIFVPTDEPATIAEVYVVESFGAAIPQSEVVRCTVAMNDEWSGWTDDKWPNNTYEHIDTRTMYRYQTKSTTTSNSKNMSGWTHYNTTTSSSSGSSYGYVAPITTDAHVRTVSTSTENTYTTWYRYHHYTNGGYNTITNKNATWYCTPWYGNNSGGYGPTVIGPHYYESSSRLPEVTDPSLGIVSYIATCPHTVSNQRYSCQRCLNTWFFNETPFQKVTGFRTKYSYTDTYYTYYFYKWSNWSSWTETAQTQSDVKNVQSKTQYRYKMDNLGIEDNTGVKRIASTVSAGLTANDILLPNLKEYAGNAVTLYIYKYNEASDWTGEYIGQQTIDTEGNYSFDFVLREEPSVETGDYIVSIGIEGCTETITVGKIIAPNPEYKVVFKYRNPSDNTSEYIVLDEQIIAEGDAAVTPEHIEFEGYKFLGWNTDLSYVTEDTMFVEYGEDSEEKIITFTANYEPEEYVVVFIDWDNDSVVMKRYMYGENIVAPIIKTAEGYESLWEGLDIDNPIATCDTVITAKHTKKLYEVNFYNYDGEIIDTQHVEYGTNADDVAIDEKDNYIFVDWEYSENLFDNAIVEGETIYTEDPVINFYPVYVFDETVENPVSSLEDGTYSEAQTIELSTETVGAVIYYTLDGTDPKTAVNDSEDAERVFEYTGPITLDRSATLKYYACAFEKNDSDVITNYYAVNAGKSESEWMLEEDIPDYVIENSSEYKITSADGYRYLDIITSTSYSEIADYEAQGWEKTGFEYGEWSDWTMSEPSVEGTAYEIESMEPEPELEVRYQYSRYKYSDPSTGKYNYSPTEVVGVDCEYETITLEDKLATAGYLSGTTTKYYLYNNERWFNYEITEAEVVPDYLMYRYRLKVYTLTKWSAWTTELPLENDSVKTESATVYKYLIPEMCLVKIVPDYSEFGTETLTYIMEVNDYLTIDEADYTFEGYDFAGFYTDSEFKTYFNHKSTPIRGEISLYPKYIAHTFEVVFVDYNGKVISEETVEYGQSAYAPEEIERNGYVFIGWDCDTFNFVTENMVITAQYVSEDEYCTVSLNHSKYALMSGSSVQLEAKISPDDAEIRNLIWYSTDESVLIVSDDGFVTAVGEGEASIIVETESTGFSDVCIITVASNPSESLCLNYSSKLNLDKENKLLRGLTNSVWTVSAIKKEFLNDEENLQIADIKGNSLAGDALVGTGTVIKFMNGDKLLDEVYVVIAGDMNGDGYVNNRDAAMISRYLVEKETADLCQMVAIDVNGDGYVNNRDAAMLSRYLVGKETI